MDNMYYRNNYIFYSSSENIAAKQLQWLYFRYDANASWASSEQASKFQTEVNQIIKSNKNVSRFFTLSGLSSGADQSTGIVNIVLKHEIIR